MSGSARTWTALATLGVLIAGLAAGCTGSHHHERKLSRGTPGRPNIVLILTDVQRWYTLQAMHEVQRLLVRHGVTFTNAFVSDSLCCPSRASILTGEYAHSTGIYSNEPPYGGFP